MITDFRVIRQMIRQGLPLRTCLFLYVHLRLLGRRPGNIVRIPEWGID